MSDAYSIDVKVDPKGRITIPRDVRAALGAARGGRVTFVVENDEIRVVNTAVSALTQLQTRLGSAAGRVFPDEQSVSDRIAARRKEDAR